MDTLELLRLYAKRGDDVPSGYTPFSINLITNFTDETLERFLGGICLTEQIYPTIVRAPYKQYAMVLKDTSHALYQRAAQISFIFFDINPYAHAEFATDDHVEDLLSDIERYSKGIQGTVVVSLALLPYRSAYGHGFADDPLFARAQRFNQGVSALSKSLPNLHVFDTNSVMNVLGELQVRDMRGAYAFDMPFTNDFLATLVREWFAYIRALAGKSKKCLVLDLDNTLWGGVVGEAGPLGIELGAQYPGVAFQNFQRLLLTLWERGIILAICSKNNLADVQEVFEKNPHMILKEEHFAAIKANWDEKSDSIDALARELNIGTEAMVFLDDSPIERDRVKQLHPEVLVPDFSLAPEEYVPTLLSLMPIFHQLHITDEDKQKGKMYAQERMRNELKAHKSKEEYLQELNIQVHVYKNDEATFPRVAQLTQKTNQFNLTTKRYSEADLYEFRKKGADIYVADVTDKFGGYGLTVVGIVTKDTDASLDTFLMSCRVMGRNVEFTVLNHMLHELVQEGYTTVTARYIPTAKNAPTASFLSDAGFIQIDDQQGSKTYQWTR